MPTRQSERHATGVFPTRDKTESAIQALQDANFPMGQVSVVAKTQEGDRQIAGVHLKDSEGNHAGGGARAGAVTGGVGGAVIGALEALGVTTTALALLPGAGQVLAFGSLAANAFATAVAGGAIGAAGGGLLGGLIGWGVPEHRAKIYHDLVSKGEYLVMVEGNDEEMRKAESVLNPYGIHEWAIYHMS